MKYPVLIGESRFSLEPYFSLEEIGYDIESWIPECTDFVAYDCEGLQLKLLTDTFSYEKANFWGKKKELLMKEISLLPQEPLLYSPEKLITDLRECLCPTYEEDQKLVAYLKKAALPVLINMLVRLYRLDRKYWDQKIRRTAFCYPLTIQVADADWQTFETLKAAEAALYYRLAQVGLYSGFDGAGRRLVVEPYKKNKVVISLIEGVAVEAKPYLT